MDRQEIHAALEEMMDREQKKGSGIFELHHVSRFRGYHNDREGSVRSIDIEISDAGETLQPSLRYAVSATSTHPDTGEEVTITGNNAESIQTAIAIAHWGKLP